MVTDNRPILAVVAQEITPYRLHLHRRIVSEIPELKLSTLLTYDSRRSPWQGLDDPAIGVVRFGEGQVEQRKKGRVAAALFELREAAQLGAWLDQHHVAAMLTIGYTEWSLFRPMLWAHRRRVPILFWADANIRGDRAVGIRRFVKDCVFPRIARLPSAFLPCGSLGRDYFLKYGVSPDRIFFSPCEPDYGEIARVSPGEIGDVLSRFGLVPGRRRFLFCGRLLSEKRPDLALQAFMEIAERRPEWDLILAGEGPLRSMLEAQVPNHLRARVRFTGFLADQRMVSALYRACDVLVHVSDYEPWALVINEASAAGLAIVATNVVGAAAELVKDGINGKVIPRGNLAALASALIEVTAVDRIDAMRASSPAVLAEWRQRADPIKGLREALRFLAVLPSELPDGS